MQVLLYVASFNFLGGAKKMEKSVLTFSEIELENCGFEYTKVCEEVVVNKEKFTVTHDFWRRLTDDHFVVTEAEVAGNLRRDYDAYRAKHQLLAPEEVKNIREKYGLGLRDFSRLLGVGFSKLAEVERGALQKKYLDNLLRMADDPYALLKLVTEKPTLLSVKVREDLKVRLREIMVEQNQKNNRIAGLLKLDYLDQP